MVHSIGAIVFIMAWLDQWKMHKIRVAAPATEYVLRYVFAKRSHSNSLTQTCLAETAFKMFEMAI